MNHPFSEIRTPIFKVLDIESLSKTTDLYIKYTKNQLTKELVLNSKEDKFEAAVLYNELYDIKEYLLSLRDTEITNHSYNILKYYLKFQNEEFIESFFGSQKKDILNILKGEIYRINKIKINDFNEYTFIGYISIGDVILPNFEEAFGLFAKKNVKIINLLDIAAPRIYKIVLKKFRLFLGLLIETNRLSLFIENIDVNKLKSSEIVKICKNKNFENPVLVGFLEKINKDSKILEVAITGGFHIYQNSKELIFRKLTSQNFKPKSELIMRYFSLILFYEPFEFCPDEYSDILKSYKDSEFYKLIFKIKDAEILKKLRDDLYCGIKELRTLEIEGIPPDMFITIDMFLRFYYLLSFELPELDTILSFPEKFFSYSLRFFDTQDLKNIRIFNENPLNQRMKADAAKNIEKSIFIKYLIKRYKLFDIPLDGYEYMMDNRYKLMYAQYNIEWASRNIQNLEDIGIPEKLYRTLSNSKYKSCLDLLKTRQNFVHPLAEMKNDNLAAKKFK